MGGLKALPFPYKKVCKKEGTVENQDEKEFLFNLMPWT